MSLPELNQQFEEWTTTLHNPLWYKEVMPVLIDWWESLAKENTDPRSAEIIKDRIYQFFTDKLTAGEISLAKNGPDFDQWRKPIDTVVIHYTHNKPGLSAETLSAIGLLRQYAHDYFKYDDIYGLPITDQPIWSGHFNNDKPVFYAYHWLVRLDGSYQKLLEDKYIGWHAGNKEINFSSIGIVLDGEFENSEPPQSALEGIAKLIKENYSDISKDKIVGHLEVNPKTKCPGEFFLTSWKQKITDLL